MILSRNNISFYYNKSNEIQQYNYQKYSEIKAQNEINNISILEFNDNYVIVCSGEFKLKFSNNCYLTIINISKIRDDLFQNDYSIHKINGLVLYYSVFEENNILVRLGEDILGIGGEKIYIYSIKNEEIIQIVEVPSIMPKYYYKTIGSFYIEKNQFIYIAVKYFLEKNNIRNFYIKFYIYSINDDKYLKNDNELEFLSFLSETKYNPQKEFYKATEI